MRPLLSLDTPALLLDLGKLEAIYRRLLQRCRSLGMGLRPI